MLKCSKRIPEPRSLSALPESPACCAASTLLPVRQAPAGNRTALVALIAAPPSDTEMAHDEYIGVTLAVCSSIAVGTSYVTTKVGLKDASQRHGFKGDGFEYFRSPIWWAGMIMLVLGEVFNFAAYAFAPAILVTPLGALSVLTGTILGAYFLGERLSVVGRLGCALCLIGSVLIVANAPPDHEIETVNEILQFAVQPGKPRNTTRSLVGNSDTLSGFLFFCFVTAVFTVAMIYFVCPKYGTMNPVFYLSVCASTGAVSVMALKAFGIAIKLTFAGENQFVHLSTYLFATVAIGCIAVQMNYFNKALSTFSQSLSVSRSQPSPRLADN